MTDDNAKHIRVLQSMTHLFSLGDGNSYPCSCRECQALKAAVGALEESQNAQRKIDALEELRPHWAQGYSEASVAAQALSAALSQIWRILGAKNQTEAVMKLHALVATAAQETANG